MEEEKGQVYYEAVKAAINAIETGVSLKEALEKLIASTALALQCGVSLMLIDSSQKKLVHAVSRGLPHAYLQKGLLDIEKSLGDVREGHTVTVEDIRNDPRVQYPDPALEAGIGAMLGVPVKIENRVAGAIRIYRGRPHHFPEAEIEFVQTMGRLTGIAMKKFEQLPGTESVQAARQSMKIEPEKTLLQQVQRVVFAHPSEKEFARLLDFYNLEWIYEPHSFPLTWEENKVTEMFTPDFFLPGLDLYVELTTLKQSLVTKKNRKLRRLRELYPEIKITLLYKKDFERLLGKYGEGPLAEKRSQRIEKVMFSTVEIQEKVQALAEQLSRDYHDSRPVMVGVLRGVFCFISDLVRAMTIPLDIEFMAISSFHDEANSAVKITRDLDINISGRRVILVEDIVDTGMTLSYLLKYLQMKKPASLAVCTLLDKRVRRLADVTLEYTGFEVPDEFLVGYGLDFEEEYRNLPYIGILALGEREGTAKPGN